MRLHFAADELELEIEDHGVGFAAQRAKRGLGLVAMRERAELLAGSLTFETPAGGGTIVRLRIPKESVIRETQEMHA